MAKVTVPTSQQTKKFQISPDYVRISMAAAIELGLKPGRIHGCHCTCINLLQNYPEGCFANCSYCGLARERPGVPEENTFIRVDWPLYPTDLVAEKIGQKEAQEGVGRVCIAQVQDHRANSALIAMTRQVKRSAPEVPISALVTATLLDEDVLQEIKAAGADIIGIGMDAATEEIFYNTRGKGAKGPHDWDYHWKIARLAREMYGPFKVNCHIIIGLGETDQDLVNMFFKCYAEQIACYLFSFNPEPGTVMQDVSRQPIDRHRRIQLVKHLIEHEGLTSDAIDFDEKGAISQIHAPEDLVNGSVHAGIAFMTDGCPDRNGVMACNRPCGSYRPGDDYRDYPFLPGADDIAAVRSQMRLHEIWAA